MPSDTRTARWGVTPGVYAIDPRAMSVEQAWDACRNVGHRLEADGKVAVVDVCGPISYAHPIAATYDSVLGRLREAIASQAHTIVLRVDSPGGDVYGAFDAAREVRKLSAVATAAGKRLIGYTDSQACSSGYALISGCPEISVSSTGTLGSIGVIATLGSLAAAEAAAGVRFALVTSGRRKADGNPHGDLNEEVIEAAQVGVDAMAAVFFALVTEHRGIDPRPLEAGVFVGADAVTRGLANRCESYTDFLAYAAEVVSADVAPILSKQPTAVLSAAITESNMPDEDKKEDAVRAALVTASESDDPTKASKAKKALAAYDEKEDAKAESDSDDKGEDKKEEAVAAASALATTVQSLAAKVAAFEQREADSARASFLATRPDLAPELVASLAKTPLSQLKAIVNAIPKGVVNPLVASTSTVTSGAGEGTAGSRLPAAEKAKLDQKMGLSAETRGVVSTPNKLSFGAVTSVTVK